MDQLNLILILCLVAIIVIILCHRKNINKSFADPYSLDYHRKISEKEDWWNVTHKKKFFWYNDMVPEIYKE